MATAGDPDLAALGRVAVVLPFYPEGAPGDPVAAAARYPAQTQLVAALRAIGVDAYGFQSAPRDARLNLDSGAGPPAGGYVRFIRPSRLELAVAHGLHRRMPRHGPYYWAPNVRLWRAVTDVAPRLVHLMGLALDPALAMAAMTAGRCRAQLVTAFHGGHVTADPVTQHLRRLALARFRFVMFSHPGQATPWLDLGLLQAHQVRQVMETSVLSAPVPITGPPAPALGEPHVVMLGRLEPIKDPTTAIAACAIAAETLPALKLTIVGGGSLENALRGLVSSLPSLAGRVTFPGRLDHGAAMETLQTAHLLLLASRREWSSLAVLEGMARGVWPVVSDLPALVAMTGGGRAGSHFPPGHPNLAAAALVRAAGMDPAMRTHIVRGRFETALSFQALARRLGHVYAEAVWDPTAEN